MFGRRSDGKRIKGLSAYRRFFPYMYKTRTDAQVFFSQKIDLEKTLEYMKNVRKGSGGIKVSLFHIILAASARTMALRPQLDRFVKGKTIYQHNSIDISFVVKKQLTEEAPLSNAKISFTSQDTLADIVERVKDHLTVTRSDKRGKEEKELDLVMKMPRWLIRFFIGTFKFLDYLGLAPRSMIKADPMYTSVFVANLGSIRLDAPFHHCFNWGTASVFIAIGKVIKEPVVSENGQIEVKNILTTNFSMDNRVTDGMYAAKAIQLFVDFIKNPERLEKPLELDKDPN